VSAIYEAFGKGDVPTILSHLSEEVAWESWADNWAQKAGVPWMAPRQGRQGTLEFFKIIGEFQFKDFQVLSLMAGDNQVAAEVVSEANVPSTGSHFREEEMHLWTFDSSGQVVRFRHYLDTAKHIAVASGRAAT
ncbi:MAG TPA: nuclear transport factor 2 family protein, partial [Anaerolineae bacterium]|nr:nuclear transport factor 2 family protein [Anaerolineae bacterium]